MAATPFGANQESICMIKAMSAFDFGANTPAGAKRGSLIKTGLSVPSHFIE